MMGGQARPARHGRRDQQVTPVFRFQGGQLVAAVSNSNRKNRHAGLAQPARHVDFCARVGPADLTTTVCDEKLHRRCALGLASTNHAATFPVENENASIPDFLRRV
jgi:hypothetical protein